jgi:hypothetical protein
MNRFSTLSFILFLLFSRAIAQPTFNLRLPQVGYISNNNIYQLPESVSPGPAGANQTWSFTLPDTATFKIRFDFILPSASPFPDSFPTSNITIKGVINNGIFQVNTYDYYKLTGDLAELVGTISSFQQNSFTTRFVNPETILGFPLLYNQTFTDTYISVNKITGGIGPENDTTFGTKTVKYDGYGSISTPQGFFSNVVRLKETDFTKNSNLLTADNISTKYYWLKSGPVVFDPVFSLQFDTTTDLEGNETFNVSGLTSGPVTSLTPVISNSEISAFPNPVSDVLNITYTTHSEISSSVSVFDLKGHLVDVAVLNKTPDQIQLHTKLLPSGIYTIKISQGAQQSFIRVTKE